MLHSITTNITLASSSSLDDFATFLSHPSSQLSLDLSNASVTNVIKAYESFKKRQSPSFSSNNLLYNIRKLESAFHCEIMPTQINDIFYSYWQQFLLNQGCVYSTIQCYFDQMRAALRWATRHHCNVADTFDCYKIPNYSKTNIALTPDHVSHIYHFDISSIPYNELPVRISKTYLSKVRDMFVLACSLGQRYSDMVRITPDHFDETKTIMTIIQQKTSAKAVVDIKEFSIDPNVALDILRKYDYFSPKTGSINNYNYALHFLLHKIGGQFLRNIKTENKINGKIDTTLTPMYKLISSHTARRTFITQNILRGKPEIKIRRASGHVDGRHFGVYAILD